MSNRKRILLIIFTLVLCIGCDQVTKHLAKENLSRTKIIPLAGSILNLNYSENRDGSFVFE